MYEFRPVSDRIEKMHQRVRDRVIQTDAERARIVTESYQRNENVIPIIKRPTATYDVCAQKTIRVEEDEIIVGNKGVNFCGSVVYPEWEGSSWVPECVESGAWKLWDDGLYHNPTDEELKLTISPEDAEYLLSIRDYWKTRTITAMADAWQPDGYDEFAALEVSDYVPGSTFMFIPCGHLIAGYKKIINVGYGAIRKQAQDWIDAHIGNLMGQDMNKFLFYKSAVIACDAGSILCKRYGDECLRQAAECKDEKRKAELQRMGESLHWIEDNPARNFWEAVQLTMMYQLLLQMDANYPSPALGRIDQYTWPFLKKDLEEGNITMDEAQEIVDAFFLKCNCYYGASPAWLTMMTGIGNTYQHTTIGGVDPQTGEDATNPVTYMVLESVGRIGLHDPTISLRMNKNSPEKLWDCAIETSKRVGGLPLFQNDDVIIPGLQQELGFTLEDARDYGIIGCQEIVGCGNDYPAPNGVHPPHSSVHYSAVMTMALNNGTNPTNGKSAPIKTGYLYEMKDMDEVHAAVEKMVKYIVHWQATANNYTEVLSMQLVQHAALSISMDGCMEKGLDANCGGCKYNSYGGTATGLATIADSMSTIKYMCFDKKLCTTRELYDAFMANWEGHEALRQQILAEVPHYGNNDPYVDQEMNWIINVYYDACQECHSVRAKVYKCGLYGAADHVHQGHTTWATPDGRKHGEPIADACSPAQSRDKNGPTSVFLSSLCFDHTKFMDGIALNIRIHPTSLSREDGVAKLRDMVKTYFASGGMETQFNVVSTETMRKAQENPEQYRNLVVRIAGYSAYFVELNRDCQNDVISRNENVL